MKYSKDYLHSDEFLRRLIHREEAAFQLLFEYFYRSLCFYATKIMQNEDEAKDIVQDVFVSFWQHDLSLFTDFKAIKVFLYNSVQNKSLNYLRDLEIRERNYHQFAFFKEEQEYYVTQKIKSEVVAEIYEAIEQLPDRCKEVFKMAYIEEHEEKDIARILGISVNTVKTQKLRAKKHLKELLGDLFMYALLLFPALS